MRGEIKREDMERERDSVGQRRKECVFVYLGLRLESHT